MSLQKNESLSVTNKEIELTLLPSLIDQFLALSRAHLLVACALVEYLGCIRVSVVHTDDPMAPALA